MLARTAVPMRSQFPYEVESSTTADLGAPRLGRLLVERHLHLGTSLGRKAVSWGLQVGG
jgi:hypothetical protein